MLNITSDSFLFAYNKETIAVFPALEVFFLKEIGNSNIDSTDVTYKTLSDFFGEFISCFIGDYKPLLQNEIISRNLIRDEEVESFINEKAIPLFLLIEAEYKGQYYK
jgi:hypothetical protein